MSQIKKNIAYQTIYQIINTCIPLITSPYLARTLGASQQGVFSYTQSIVNYFTLFAMMGFLNYGSRTLALYKDNKDERSRQFWNIYSLQGCLSLIALGMYTFYIIVFCKENVTIAIFQGLYLFGALLDINWAFFGTEHFEITVKRSIIIRVITLLCILFFVKKPDDLWLYTLIMAGGTVLSNLVLWKCVSRIVNIKAICSVSRHEVMKHFKPCFVLFIPILAMSVFHIMDKTMLGRFSTYEQTGFYYNADKIINIPIGIIEGIGTVMLPRMTLLAKEGNKKNVNSTLTMSIEMIVSLSVAMAFGIAAIAHEFVPVFFGDGFEACVSLIMILSPVLIVKSLSHTSRMQYLIPNHLERYFIESVYFGAVVNFVLNYVLIRKYGAVGAVIGTITAESVTCLWQYSRMRKHYDVVPVIKKSLVYLLFGIVMFATVRSVANTMPIGACGIVLEVFLGVSVYGGLCFLFWKKTNNPIVTLIRK